MSDRPTLPPGLDEIKQDVRRLEWAQRGAYSYLVDLMRQDPKIWAAWEKYQRARERAVLARHTLDKAEREAETLATTAETRELGRAMRAGGRRG